jgi:hypothetical protein
MAPATPEKVLHNGIVRPSPWPPTTVHRRDRSPLRVPYLEDRPTVVPIDVGRQLFVDSFLIESTNLTRTAHNAEVHQGNPILKPETPIELEGGMACTFDDGVFFDPADGLFKMFYLIGYYTGKHSTALATSTDGIHWDRPDWGIVPGTNVILPGEPNFARDNFSPWLDHFSENPEERWKAYLYLWPRDGDAWGHALKGERPEWLLTSPDGVHWHRRQRFLAESGDCTSLFHDPFNDAWVLNIRSYLANARDRCYFARRRFMDLASVSPENRTYWLRADALDVPDPDVVALRSNLSAEEMARITESAKQEHVDRWFGEPTQLYTIAPTPYESMMLGVFTIHYGPENCVLEKRDEKQPKLTQIKLGYSRDGFHYARPDREPFIAASKMPGRPDRGYLRGAGGGCLIVGDKLHFYHSGATGETHDGRKHLYAGGCMNLATLRRDGFVSYDADARGGILITRPVMFSGSHLFVNANAERGILRIGLRADETIARIAWRGGDDLSRLARRPVRFLFELTNASLFSFWVSTSESGASHGYLAAGAPGYGGPVDTVGIGGMPR